MSAEDTRDSPSPTPLTAEAGERPHAHAMTRTVVERVTVGGVELDLERPEDPESLIDEEAFGDDEFLPYWAERWPSGVALAAHLTAVELHGKRVLELGCGLGLPSLVAARNGADVVATDWSEDAIELLGRNATRNGVGLSAMVADWRDHDAFGALDACDLALAADVLYEARNAGPILALLERLGCPLLVADPGRRHADAFFAAAGGRGWRVEWRGRAGLACGGIHHLHRPGPPQATRTAMPGYSTTSPSSP
jgi:predicted nicotinamide N-methyase